MLTEEERELFQANADRAIEWHKREAAHAWAMAKAAGQITTRWDRAKWFLSGCVTGTVSQFIWEAWLDVG